MERIAAAWHMEELAIVAVVMLAIGPVAAEALVDHNIETLAIGPVFVAEVLVGRKVDNSP